MTANALLKEMQKLSGLNQKQLSVCKGINYYTLNKKLNEKQPLTYQDFISIVFWFDIKCGDKVIAKLFQDH